MSKSLRLSFVFLSTFIGFQSFAEKAALCETPLFATAVGSSRWNSDKAFVPLENLGIRMGAVDDAFSALGKQGYALRAMLSSTLDAVAQYFYDEDYKRQRLYTTASAVAAGLDAARWSEQKRFTQEVTWFRDNEFTHLLTQGVRYDALERALIDCYAAGYLVCTVAESQWKSVNFIKDGKYHTTGVATVIGMSPLGDMNPAISYRGTSTWNGDNSFSELELLGVRMAAVENGISELGKRGSLVNAPMLTSLAKVNLSEYIEQRKKNRLVTTADAIVLSLDQAGWMKGEVFTGKNNWSGHDAFTVLEVSGIRYDALQRALSSCYQAGYLVCAMVEATATTTNSYDSNVKDGRPYSTAATARVVGYRPRGQ